MKYLLLLILFCSFACENQDFEIDTIEDQEGLTVATRHKCRESIDIDNQVDADYWEEKPTYCIRGDLTIVNSTAYSVRIPSLVKVYGRLVVVNNSDLQDLRFDRLRYVRDGLFIISNPRLCADYFVPRMLEASTGYNLEPLPAGYLIDDNGSCTGYPDL